MLENEYPYDKDMMIEGPYDSLSTPMPMLKQGGRVGLANGTSMKMASAPDPMDERNMVMENIAMEEFGKPLDQLSDDEIIQIDSTGTVKNLSLKHENGFNLKKFKRQLWV